MVFPMLSRFSNVMRTKGSVGYGTPQPASVMIPYIQRQLPRQQYEKLSMIQQQIRCRWTKAKKKRVARYERRQELERNGIAIPKPGMYTPKDTPVIHSSNKDDRRKEMQEQDERASMELRSRLQAAAVARENTVLRYHMTNIAPTINDRVRKLLSLHNGNQKEVIKVQKQLGMSVFQLRDGDTGSSAVQIIALTTRIQQLQTHLSKHKKDKHSKRGMDALFVRRRKLLDYLEREDFHTYHKVVKTLGFNR